MSHVEKLMIQYYEVLEKSVLQVLNNRPRYLRWIPKLFYTKHFLEIRQPKERPLYRTYEKGTYSVTIAFRIWDKLRKKYVK